MTKTLILGGTGQAHELCVALHQTTTISFIHSRAGVLNSPPLPYPYREGGFGGIEGLQNYIKQEEISHIVVATHPFAEQIAAHAKQAAQQLQIPLLRLERDMWEQPKGANWHQFSTYETLIAALPQSTRTFLTIGSKDLNRFTKRTDLWFLWRVIEPSPIKLHGQEIIARPPFSLENEINLITTHNIDQIVTKESGGEHTFAKLQAAAKLKKPVFMLSRPNLNFTTTANTITKAIEWLEET
ncbi:MAG: cobalt-precorrin-6A reductase [Pseudomonadota bacterium]